MSSIAAGEQICDNNGNEYIDLGSGIGVNAFGACDEEWIKAVEAQLHKLSHLSNLYYTEPQVKLAQMLCEKTGMNKVFFGNSGARQMNVPLSVRGNTPRINTVSDEAQL